MHEKKPLSQLFKTAGSSRWRFAPACIQLVMTVSFILIVCMLSSNAGSESMPKNSWKELGGARNLLPVNGASYYQLTLPNGSTAHLVVAYFRGGKWQIRPFVCEKTATTSSTAAAHDASAAINGGYFNLSDGQSASYATSGGKLLADPHHNHALMENPKLQPFMPQVLNRSEIRFLRSKANNKQDIQIARHSDPLPEGQELVDSLQAGPRLLPTLDQESEAFMRKQADGTSVDSIGCLKPAARSAFGLTPEGYAMFLAVSGKAHDKESSGITLLELSQLLKRLGCREAINLDGGSSTSMYVRLADDKDSGSGQTVCAKSPETLVKTVLLLLPQ